MQATDQSKKDAFVEQTFGDIVGFMNVVLAGIGDRFGLWKELAAHGPMTSLELARRANVNERYLREWLGGMASAGYLNYDPNNAQFTLPVEHAPVLAEEQGEVFLGGAYQEMLGHAKTLDKLLRAFRHGGGIGIPEFAPDVWEGMERFTTSWFDNLLVQKWIPLLSEVESKLKAGVQVADIGCGHGKALIALAKAFPSSHYTGYDISESGIEKAKANVEQAGLASQIQFEVCDVSLGLPEQYDIITTFDVVHDAADPLGMLRAIRRALRRDGIYVCLDTNCSDKLEENLGPTGAYLYGISLLFCMTMSLAAQGEGLGTLGLNPTKLRELVAEAGFGQLRQVDIDNPINNLYEIRP